MHSSIHDKAIELLLKSMSRAPCDGHRSQFFYGKPGAPMWARPAGATVYFWSDGLLRAALHIRQHGPSHLRDLPIGSITSSLIRFVSENYWYLANGALLGKVDDDSYLSLVSDDAKAQFAEALSVSELLKPQIELTVFPLVPVRVEADFDSEAYFLVGPGSLSASRLPAGVESTQIASESFPPLAHWGGQRLRPNSWLGIRSPVLEVSNRMKAAILGALALTQPIQCRHLFSLREAFGGYCTIGEQTATSFGNSHTPALMYDVVVTDADHAWLMILAEKLLANTGAVRRHLNALRYFCRSWELSASERFPVLCMALDAIFGEANHATQAVVDGVRSVVGSHVPDSRLRLLMDLRASVIHGGAPDVYDSSKYVKYYRNYETDPVGDLELVVAACLRAKIFGEALKEHPDPNAHVIAQMQEQGMLSKNLRRSSILDNVDRN